VEFVAFEPESALRIGEGIVLGCGLESRMPRRFSIPAAPEEGVKAFIHPAKNVLKNLTVYLAYVFTDLFDLWKLDGLSVIVDRKAVNPVGVPPFLSPKPGRRRPDSVAEPCVKVCLHTAPQ